MSTNWTNVVCVRGRGGHVGLLQSHYPLRTSVPPLLLALLLLLESVGLVSGSPSPVSATSAKFPSWTHSKKSRATADCSGRPLAPPRMLHDMSPQLSSAQLKVERSFSQVVKIKIEKRVPPAAVDRPQRSGVKAAKQLKNFINILYI